MGEKKVDSQSNSYQLTINNPVAKGWTHDRIKSVLVNNFKTFYYACMADERGETYHTHLFVYFKSRVRFSTVKSHFPEAHIEACKGLVSQNIAYVKKTGKWADSDKAETRIEGSFEEVGTPPPDSKGRNFEMSELYEMVSEGLSDAEIIRINQDYIPHLTTIARLRQVLLIEKYKGYHPLDVRYIFGETATGKSRYVLEKYAPENVYRVTDYVHPFDGYNCQPVLVFEEFRQSLRLSDLLNFCDVYATELPARYANKSRCYDSVYIISNWPLEMQYRTVRREDEASYRAFLRRISEVLYFYEPGKFRSLGTATEYIDRLEKNAREPPRKPDKNGFIELTEEQQMKLPFD